MTHRTRAALAAAKSVAKSAVTVGAAIAAIALVDTIGARAEEALMESVTLTVYSDYV